MFKGHLKAIIANMIWGSLPIYFYFIGKYPPLILLSVQMISTFLVVLLFLLISKRSVFSFLELKRSIVPACLLIINWGGYAVAVKAGYVIEASFAYLILPVLLLTVGYMLSSVAHRSSIICILLCLAIVAFECYLKGVFPIIGFAIAAPFAAYILWHSKYNVEPVKALFYETSLMLPIGIIILPSVNFTLISDWELNEMLYLSILGILTVLPLLLFVSSTKVVSFDILSIYQLLSPVLGISIGIVLYNQSIEGHTFISYSALIFVLISYNLYLFSTKAKNHV
tara:strand:- start:1509 stop:2354 length:846 start_codon:yes stop_codon:yes gene_type:complete